MGEVTYINKGIYSVARAATLAGVRSDAIRRWATPQASSGNGPVIRPDYTPVDNEISLSFLDLVEVQLVARLREEGLSLQRVREAHRFISQEFGVVHPFAWQKLETDGRDLFIRWAFEDSDDLIIKASGKRQSNIVFTEVVEPYFRHIDFSPSTYLAERYYPLGPEGGIVLDPRIVLGQPVVAGTRIPTRSIVDFARAGDTPETIASWYKLTVEQVRQALVFESGLACAA